MKTPIYIIYLTMLCFLCSCGMYMVPPGGVEHESSIGEITASEKQMKNLPLPKEPIVVGVYKFRDQTGQYKPSENMANWSTAVPQGLTSMLIKSMEDSKWFVPIERENIGNLLNERQIIRTTRQEYSNGTPSPLPPLLFAGILFEGGVVSYDTNIVTGGAGARYFGIGASTEYRQDRITIYLRAVSTNNGKILKTIYTSKTILSQAINASMFRYVDTERLMEAEVGISNNEPIHMAVSEAINKAVYLMVLEGIKDGVWEAQESDRERADALLQDYNQQIIENNDKVVGKGKMRNDRRSKFSLGLNYTMNTLKGDYSQSNARPGASANFKYLISDHFNANLGFSYFEMGSEDNYKSKFNIYDLNLEYLMLPYNNFSPYIFGGAGMITDIEGLDSTGKFKVQFGGGLEYLASKYIGIRASGAYHVGFDDDWDGLISGRRDDHFLQLGIGINIYLGNQK